MPASLKGWLFVLIFRNEASDASFSPLISALLTTWDFLAVFILLLKDFFSVGIIVVSLTLACGSGTR